MTTKEEGAQAAADRIKAQALSAAKGLSRVQAERAAAAAARNVNAYGQKEEGPSRWQERKEAKRQMYLMSTEKKVTLGVRKDLLKPASGVQGAAQQCQKCFQSGHWTYECKNERVYISRPSRSQQLRNPQLKPKFLAPSELDYLKNDANAGNPDANNGNAVSKHKRKKKKMASDDSSSSMSSDDSDSSSEYSSTEESSSTDSDEERRRRRRRRHRRRSLSSSSDSYSDSESEKDTRTRKLKRHRRSASSSEADSDSEEERKSRRRKKHRRYSSSQSREESPTDSEEGKRRQRKKKKNARHSPSLSGQESLTSASTDRSESSESKKKTRNRAHEKHASAKTKKHRA